MMKKKHSLKHYLLFWGISLALCLSLLLSYQGTQFFLKGLDLGKIEQMKHAANLLPVDEKSTQLQFGYHVAISWNLVPDDIKSVFSSPPREFETLIKHYQNWWYFAPPETGYYLMRTTNNLGEQRYISLILDFKTRQSILESKTQLDPMVKIALWGLGAILTYSLLIYCLFIMLSKPISQLYKWASELSLEQQSNALPDFQYEELNALANILYTNMQSMNKALDREKEFLSYASHELRTPIATLKSDITLLDKISPSPTEKEREIRDRMFRSNHTIKGITETLLWMNREHQEPMPLVAIDVETLLKQTISELAHLLKDKNIIVTLETTESQQRLPEAPFIILITNIIRNAFQHTTSGYIHIEQNAEQIQITNNLTKDKNSTNIGFGLGLKLIRKIADRFNWTVIESQSETTKRITFKLPK